MPSRRTITKPRPDRLTPVPEVRIGLPFSGKPETVTLNYMASQGWTGFHTEGNLIRNLFRALAFPALCRLAPFQELSDNMPHCHAIHYLVQAVAGTLGPLHTNRFNPASPEETVELLHQCIEDRLSSDLSETAKDYASIAEWNAYLGGKAPPVCVDVRTFIRPLPNRFWHGLLDAYAYGQHDLINGWPDLELSNGTQVMLIEVKTSDSLSGFQRAAIRSLTELGVNCQVIRLIKA